MRNKAFFLTIVSTVIMLAILCGCKDKKEPVYHANGMIDIFVPDKTIDCDLSTIFKSFRFIQLDNFFPIGSIKQMTLTDNHIVVFDEIASSIVCFSKSGKFQFTIDKKGKGKGEYLMLFDYTVNEENNTITLMDPKLKKIITYDFKGQFVEENRIKIIPSKMGSVGSQLYFYNPFTFRYENNPELRFRLIKTDSKGEILDTYLKTEMELGIYKTMNVVRGFELSNDKVYFRNGLAFTYYELTEDSVIPAYHINFESNKNYDNDIAEWLKTDNKSSVPLWKKGNSTSVHHFSVCSKYVFFKYAVEGYRMSCIYDMKAKKVIYNKRLDMFDEPLLKANIPIINFPTQIHDSKAAVVLKPSAIKRWATKYADQIGDYDHPLYNLPIENNPVIAIYEIAE